MNRKLVKYAVVFLALLLNNSLFPVNEDLLIARCQATQALIDNVLSFLQAQENVLNEILTQNKPKASELQKRCSVLFKDDLLLFSYVSPGCACISEDGETFKFIELPATDLLIEPQEELAAKQHISSLLKIIRNEHKFFSLAKQRLADRICSIQGSAYADRSETHKLLIRMAELQILYFDVTKSSSDKARKFQEFTQLKNTLTELTGVDYPNLVDILKLESLLQLPEVDPLGDIVKNGGF